MAELNYFQQESNRLLFRKLTEEDIESWAEFFENNDRLHFLGLDLSKSHRTLAEEWIMKQLYRYEYEGLGHLAVMEKDSGLFIGVGGIIPREIDGQPYFEIAYSLKPQFWKRGYGTEIARQMKHFGLKNGISKSFVSIIEKNNLASIQVAIKNEFLPLFECHYLGMEVIVYGDSRE